MLTATSLTLPLLPPLVDAPPLLPLPPPPPPLPFGLLLPALLLLMAVTWIEDVDSLCDDADGDVTDL